VLKAREIQVAREKRKWPKGFEEHKAKLNK
jgi:hypothetical protein